MRAAARTAVVAGTATVVSGRVRRRQDARYQQQAEAQAYEQQAAAPMPEAPAPAPAAPAMSPVEQLTALAGLRDQGVLTEAEFELEKGKILSG